MPTGVRKKRQKTTVKKKKQTKVIGLTGGQGTGKSTISNILKIILKSTLKRFFQKLNLENFFQNLK